MSGPALAVMKSALRARRREEVLKSFWTVEVAARGWFTLTDR